MNELDPERSKNLATGVIIHSWHESITTKETNKTRTRSSLELNNHWQHYKAKTGSLLAYGAMRARLRESNIWNKDLGGRGIEETVATC
jgi:hypothetical protein